MPPMRLALAIAFSSLLHAALILGGLGLATAPAPRQAMLEVSFQQDLPPVAGHEPEPADTAPTATPATATPPTVVPAQADPASSPPPPGAAPAATTVATAPAVLLYPLEAAQRGIEGEVTVLLVLNEAGHILSADIARSSGHAVLDTAALQAVRRLGALPGNPRQTLLPVSFRLQ